MSIGTGTHFQSPVLGATDLYEDVPIEILNQTQRVGFFTDIGIAPYDRAPDLLSTTAVVAVTASAVLVNGVNGIYRITNTVANQGVGSLQHEGSTGVGAPTAWILPSVADALDGSPNRLISFGARVAVSDFSDCDWFVGLAAIDTTLMDATGVLLAVGGDNHVGFHHLVADANDVRLSSAGTAVANVQATLLSAAQQPRPVPAATAVDGVFFEYGVRIVGTQDVEFYINRTLRHRRRMANVLAAVGLVPSFAMISNGAAINFDIDYYWASQTR